MEDVFYITNEKNADDLRLGLTIKHYRMVKHMSQAELAKAVNLPVQTISNIESGLRIPKFDKVYEISKALKVSPIWLYNLYPSKEENIQTMISHVAKYASTMKVKEDGTVVMEFPKEYSGICEFLNEYRELNAIAEKEPDPNICFKKRMYCAERFACWTLHWPEFDAAYTSYITGKEVDKGLTKMLFEAELVNYCKLKKVEMFALK